MKQTKQLFICLFMMFIIPIQVFADGTEKFYIDSYINKDGSLTIKEIIVLSGTYNGTERTIEYGYYTKEDFFGTSSSSYYNNPIYNGANIANIKVGAIDINKINLTFPNEVDIDYFDKVSSGTNGQYGVYTLIAKRVGYSLKIYNPAPKQKAFYIEYTVQNAAVVHADVAEVMWNFIGSSWREYINDVKIWVNLPDDSNELRVFSHGPINGINSIESKKQVFVAWDFLNAYTSIDARVIFDKSLVEGSTKIVTTNGLDKIIEYETKAAEIQNEIREKAIAAAKEKQAKLEEKEKQKIEEKRKNKATANIISGIWLAVMTFLLALFNKMYNKGKKKKHHCDYRRELPAEYGPEILGFLLTKNKIKSNYITASILELIRKKSLRLEMNTSDKKAFTIYNTKDDYELTKTEKILKDWLIKDVGTGEKFTNIDVKNTSTKHYDSFLKRYREWRSEVIEEGSNKNFYEQDTVIMKTFIIMFDIFGFLILPFCLALYIETPMMYITEILAFIILIYTFAVQKRSEKGNEDYDKWKAFKKFLLNFGKFNEKELPDIYLWEKYLVYATAFGIADKVQKSMRMKIKGLNVDETIFNQMPVFSGSYSGFDNIITSSISKGIKTASSAQSSASSGGDWGSSSSSSSSSGGGGGSSSDGGGGGGGGGGGRF